MTYQYCLSPVRRCRGIMELRDREDYLYVAPHFRSSPGARTHVSYAETQRTRRKDCSSTNRQGPAFGMVPRPIQSWPRNPDSRVSVKNILSYKGASLRRGVSNPWSNTHSMPIIPSGEIKHQQSGLPYCNEFYMDRKSYHEFDNSAAIIASRDRKRLFWSYQGRNKPMFYTFTVAIIRMSSAVASFIRRQKHTAPGRPSHILAGSTALSQKLPIQSNQLTPVRKPRAGHFLLARAK